MRNRLQVRSIFLLSFATLACLAVDPRSLRAAEPPVTVENIRVGLQDTFKLGAWTPVWVDLKGRFTGTLEIEVPDEDGTPTYTRLPVALNSAAELRSFAGYIRPGAPNAEVVVRLRDPGGRAATRDAHLDDRSKKPPAILDPGQMMIVALGNPQGVAELPALAGFSGTAENLGRPAEIVVVHPRVPEGLPARWYGFDAASVVVLDTDDRATMEALRARGQGLKEWVRRGGHLVVAGATNTQIAAEVLGDLLPARPAGTTRLNDSGEIETFAGSTTNQLLPQNTAMSVAKLETDPARPTQVLAATTATPLVLRGTYGFGRVTMVGIDVGQKPFASWKDKSLFWVRALDLRARGGAEEAASVGSTGGPYNQGGVSDLAGLLYRMMDRPPGVTLVPFGWVAFFVFLYILLIGPGDYFFLKRVVKRMELTWITFPLIVIAVSTLAYLGAYALKGSELKIIQVDAVDVDQVDGIVRGTTWATLFSPQNRDYGVTIAPVAPTAPPSSQTERLVSAFGPPDAQVGGGGPFSLTASGYAYAPEGEAEAVVGVRIPIWSTKSFTARWFGPLVAPLVESDLVPAGSDRLDGTIANRMDKPLRNAVLVFGNQVYDQLGTIAPGAAVRIGPTSRTRPLSGYLEERARSLLAGQPESTTVAPPKESGTPTVPSTLADLVRTAMFRQGMNTKTNTPPSLPLRGLDLTGQLALERPMLVAELDGPAADLKLDGAPGGTPRTERSTVVRIIVPLRNEAPTNP
jgi:hypothetical protein